MKEVLGRAILGGLKYMFTVFATLAILGVLAETLFTLIL